MHPKHTLKTQWISCWVLFWNSCVTSVNSTGFHFEFEIFPQLLANYLSLQFSSLQRFLMAHDAVGLVTCPSLAANAERGKSCKKLMLLLPAGGMPRPTLSFSRRTQAASGKWQVRGAAGGKGKLPANGISMLVLGACSEFGNRRAQIEQKNCASGSVVLSHVSRAVTATATAGRVKVCVRAELEKVCCSSPFCRALLVVRCRVIYLLSGNQWAAVRCALPLRLMVIYESKRMG